jgi:hypothetical protein
VDIPWSVVSDETPNPSDAPLLGRVFKFFFGQFWQSFGKAFRSNRVLSVLLFFIHLLPLYVVRFFVVRIDSDVERFDFAYGEILNEFRFSFAGFNFCIVISSSMQMARGAA